MISRRAGVLLALLVGVSGIAIPQAGATHEYEYIPTTTRLFMRNSGGATCPGVTFLALEAGSGEPGCGFQGGAPVGELYRAGVTNLGNGIRTYTTQEVPPQYLDPTRNATGNVTVVATATTQRMAVGNIRVDVTLQAKNAAGQTLTLGSFTSEQLVNPTNSAENNFPFTINIADNLDKVRLDEITTIVEIRGWHILTGYHRLNGQSWTELGTYERRAIIH